MQFAVTGANGFIGHYLCRELLDHGHSVRAFVRRLQAARELDALGCELVVGDMADWDSVAALMAGCDAVFLNGYWQGHPSGADPAKTPIDFVKYVEYNLLGLYRMLVFCRDHGIANFFFVSSGAAMGSMPGLAQSREARPSAVPFDENYPCSPQTEYGAYKRSAELYIATFNRQYGMAHCTALRPMGAIMGVPRHVTRTPLYDETIRMIEGKPVSTDLESRFASCHARDLARSAMAIAALGADEPAACLYHVVGEVYPRRDVIERIRRVTQSRSVICHKAPDRPVAEISSDAAIRALGVTFCGMAGVEEQTVELVNEYRSGRVPRCPERR